MPQPTPLTLPALTPAEAAQARHLARLRHPLAVTTQIGPIALSVAGPGGKTAEDPPDWEGSWARIDVTFGDPPSTVWLPYDLVAAIASGSYPDLDVGALAPAELALVLEAAETDFFAALERRTHAAVSARAVAQVARPEREGVLALRATSPEGASIPVFIQAHPAERSRLIAALVGTPLRREPFSAVGVVLAFRCGHTVMTLGEFADLEPGCGILLDDTTLSFQKLVVVIAERFVQSCTWQTVKPVLDGPLLRPADKSTLPYTTDGYVTDVPEHPGAPAPTGGLNEVPVHLVFEVGRTEMPLAQLETIQAGYVFELGRPLSQTVDILANGRRIGTGELVRIGDGIGVKVVRLVR